MLEIMLIIITLLFLSFICFEIFKIHICFGNQDNINFWLQKYIVKIITTILGIVLLWIIYLN